jgi:peptidyl-prolyl cis-trans isomerase C
MIGDDMILNQLFQTQVIATLKIGDEEIKAFFDQNQQRFSTPERVRASHILIKFEGDENTPQAQAAKAKLEKIRLEILKKKISFAAAAKQNSDCPSKEQGGDLNFFGRGQMVPEFDKMAFESKQGEISPVFKTKFGYHILQVSAKEAPAQQALAQAKPQIQSILQRQKGDAAAKAYVEELKKKAKIEKYEIEQK